LKFLKGGLLALILTLVFQTQLAAAEYLYKDEIIHNPKFTNEVNKIGSELYKKTGISLRLLMLKELPIDMSISTYGEGILKDLKGPTVLLLFSEMNSKVDIIANDKSLYQYFDRKQVLSPVASMAQAVAMAVIFARSWDDFKQMSGDYGGTILPLLGNKTKKGELLGKYSGAMFNGYYDVAYQIAESKGIQLKSAPSNANENIIFFIKILFYGFILYALFLYFKNKKEMKRRLNEK